MIHNISISTPATTPITSKKKTHWILELGVIEDLIVYFPPGCMSFNYLQMYYHGAQVFPKIKGSFRGNDCSFVFRRVYFPIISEPLELLCLTWNVSTRFAHFVDIYANISPTWRFLE